MKRTKIKRTKKKTEESEKTIQQKPKRNRKAKTETKEREEPVRKKDVLKKNFPLGGHLPEPPEECPVKQRWIWRDGIYWIDFGMCIRTCGIMNKGNFSSGFCERGRIYLKEREEEREEALRKKERE